MGFHKRWINKETLLEYYKRDGIDGVYTYLSADALFVNDDFSSNILNLLNDKKEEEAKKMLDDETF